MFFCQAGCKALAAVEKWTQCCAPGGRHATNNINAITRATPSRAFEREPPREVPGTLNSTYALVWTRLSWCCAPGGHHDTHDTKHGHAGAKRDAGRSVGCRDQRLPPAPEPTQAGLTQTTLDKRITESPRLHNLLLHERHCDSGTAPVPVHQPRDRFVQSSGCETGAAAARNCCGVTIPLGHCRLERSQRVQARIWQHEAARESTRRICGRPSAVILRPRRGMSRRSGGDDDSTIGLAEGDALRHALLSRMRAVGLQHCAGGVPQRRVH